ncbi:hypothetical protein CKAH01_12858 [Colletotrichum kahawae]|uniref:Uncharacterized protein n=1 Tax=Colletotrichum kahawae TaxID=34407 RepID=A0AAD9YPM4_COLKA|nr:hypothetical protein CKAH01_12858 [Colletotrichum kahawae]
MVFPSTRARSLRQGRVVDSRCSVPK